MKRIFTIIMLVMLILTISACTGSITNQIIGDYSEGTKEYVVSNISSSDYKDMTVELMIENDKGHSKSIEYDVGTLKSGENYIIDMSDIDNIQSISFERYTYYESPWPYVFIVLFVFGFIIAVIILG